MDRATVYTQEQGRSVDFLFAQRATMIAIAKLAQAALGSNTIVRGLAVTPNSPAALNVLVGIGEIYTMAQVDATTWGSLGADSDVILKQGLNMAAQTISTPAPSTSGFSINYLIEVQYQDQDTTPVVLPFFNSANPQQPLNGQGGNGAPLPTERQGVCAIQAKAGVAATTGTQVTPSVDAGWTAIAVVTVANGQSTVTTGNISVPAGVPQITSLLKMMQLGSSQYAVDSSTTANQVALALTPPITSYTDGQEIVFKAANNNTGPCTINAGGGSVPLVGAAGALQGGEIVAGKQYTVLYSASLTEFVLSGQTGGSLQISPATASNHAVTLGQVQNHGLQTITGTGNFTVPANVFFLRYRMWGGGGGGGGVGSAGNGGAGGAGAGEFAEGVIAVTPGQIISCAIGAAGAAPGPGGGGGTGGTTSFTAGSTTITCAGGSGGAANAAGGGNGGSGGTGGTGAAGTRIPGASGGSGAGASGTGGQGGSTGGGGGAGAGGATGLAGSGAAPGGGGGGSGGAASNNGTSGGRGQINFEW